MKTGTMTNTSYRRQSGFTMVELLIAIIIIGILVTIIVPVLSNRASDARIAAAKADMEAIGNAESQVALDTGYIVRFHVLDDSGQFGDNIGSDSISDSVDTIRDELFNTTNNLRSKYLFFDVKSGRFLDNSLNGDQLWDRVFANPEQFGWRGPYANFQRKITAASAPAIPWVYGAPIDPWGNPYFLFLGGDRTTQGATPNGGWFNEVTGQVEITFTYVAPTVAATQFDRPTIISLGPNGVAGDGTGTAILGTGDDLMRAF